MIQHAKANITLRRGLTGAKPEAVCHWAFELVGARPDDELHDLFHGTGAVTATWRTWQRKFLLPDNAADVSRRRSTCRPTAGEP